MRIQEIFGYSVHIIRIDDNITSPERTLANISANDRQKGVATTRLAEEKNRPAYVRDLTIRVDSYGKW